MPPKDLGSAGLVDLVRRRSGAARWSELAALTSPDRIRAAVAAGDLQRVAGGVYCLPAADGAIVTAVVHRGRLSCVSAALHEGLAVLALPDTPHLEVPRSRGRSASVVRAGYPAVLHRTGGDAAVPGPPTAPLARALARMLLCQPAEHALVSIDCALAQGRVSKAAIRKALPRTAPAEAVAILMSADGRSGSPTETLARIRLRAAGFNVEPALPLPGVGWVDLLVEGCLVVELDGHAYHSGRKEFREDRRRDRTLAAQGLVVLRFTYEDVVHSPAAVLVQAVRDALAARGRLAVAQRAQPRL